MKKNVFFFLLLGISTVLTAQHKDKGTVVIGFSGGASFSNLLNSEAPHKISVLGSDEQPAIIPTFTLEESTGYIDYETGIFSDLLFAVTADVYVEYFIKDNLSLSIGIAYQSKGIDLEYATSESGTNMFTGNIWTTTETYKRKINNDYLVAPMLLRKYLFKEKRLSLITGMYLGYLLSSEFSYFNQKTSSSTNGFTNESTQLLDGQDRRRTYTNKIDFGLSFGAGYTKKLSTRLLFKSELLFSLGLRKVDAKYNNEFSVASIAQGTNFSSFILRSTNYHGLDSNSKNVSMQVSLGLGYRLGK